MTAESEPPGKRRLVDMIGAAMTHARKHGRDEFAEQLGLIRKSVIEDEVAKGYARRADDELTKWLERRHAGREKGAP